MGGDAGVGQVLEKLKGRLPHVFLIIHCFVVQSTFGSNQPSAMHATTSDRQTFLFLVYYATMNVLCFLWSLWHAWRASIATPRSSSSCTWGVGFVIVEPTTCLLLFLLVSNLTSFGIPFRLAFGLDPDSMVVSTAILLSLVYFLNALEDVYCRDLDTEYLALEQHDDVEAPLPPVPPSSLTYQAAPPTQTPIK